VEAVGAVEAAAGLAAVVADLAVSVVAAVAAVAPVAPGKNKPQASSLHAMEHLYFASTFYIRHLIKKALLIQESLFY
jgi:hypothetical protein